MPAFSVNQPEEGMLVLEERAKELKVRLTFFTFLFMNVIQASSFSATPFIPEISGVHLGVFSFKSVGCRVLNSL